MEAPSAPFSTFGEALAADPYPFYAQLRQAAPVAKIGPAGLWTVARYDDVVRILRDPETFSSVVGARQLVGEDVPSTMLFSDPPIHTRLRNLVARAFTPRMVERQRPAIQERCDELIAAMCAKDEADIVAELAYPLPIMVIANMLGVADGDHATFKRWSDDIIENIAPIVLTGDDSALTETNQEFDAYFGELLEALRRRPEENLLSALVHVETEEGRLTQEELLMFCRLLLVAGNETTTGLLVNATRAFSEHPNALKRVKADLSLLPGAIEESLRFYAPFQATFRRATKDVEVAGVTIPAGDRVLVLLGSANRDGSAFERPEEFDIERGPNRHVSFGLGIHFCIGAPLARLEGDIALRTLLPRIRSVTIEDTEPGALLRPGGPKSLRVRFEREPAED